MDEHSGDRTVQFAEGGNSLGRSSKVEPRVIREGVRQLDECCGNDNDDCVPTEYADSRSVVELGLDLVLDERRRLVDASELGGSSFHNEAPPAGNRDDT